MRKRIRFGLNLSLPFGLFKNAGIFVIYVEEGNVAKFRDAVETIRGVLVISGRGEVASALVFEFAN